jgi:hypothetical protein
MDYGDDPSLKGAVQTQGSVTTYTLHEDEELSVNMGPTMADAITEEKIVIDNGNLVSLQLKIPVIHTDHVESDGSVILNFTGEHQTLCLQSAD